jgi:hypothetical protein
MTDMFRTLVVRSMSSRICGTVKLWKPSSARDVHRHSINRQKKSDGKKSGVQGGDLLNHLVGVS